MGGNVQENGKRHKLILGVFGFFVVVGIIGGGWWWYYSSKYVTTDDARVSGTIVSISSKVNGKIAEVLVAEGDTVKAGQVLVRIDPKDIAAQKAGAEAAVAVAKANYDLLVNGLRPQEIQQAQASADQALASLNNAATNYYRMQQLFDELVISASQRDAAFTAYQVAKETYKTAKEGLDLAQIGSREEAIRGAAAQLKQAEATLTATSIMYEDTTIVSPVDGVVALKSVNPGEVVVFGQPLFSVVNTNDIWVNARIEETYIGKLRVGQQVDYTIDGYPNRTFSGKIYEIGNAAISVFALIPTENASNNFTKVTQRIPVKISLPQGENVIFRPGMSAIIKVHLD
jgi:multidrug resistance efflux pump